MPIRDWPFAVLALIWVAGRIAVVGGFGEDALAVAPHVLGIGGMTLTVMILATFGHTGQPLVMGSILGAVFWLVITAGVVRGIVLYAGDAANLPGLIVAATLRSIKFATAAIRLLSILWFRSWWCFWERRWKAIDTFVEEI